MDTLKALLVENIHPDASARLAKEGCDVETLPRALGEDELIEALRGVSLLGIRSSTHVTGRVLEAAPSLVAIGAFCIGVNQVDLAAAILDTLPHALADEVRSKLRDLDLDSPDPEGSAEAATTARSV